MIINLTGEKECRVLGSCVVSLAEMKTGQRGEIVQILGGRGMVRRLWVLGVVPGKKVEKVSSLLGSGPVVIRLGQQEIALGRGVAQKILVKVGG